MNNPVVVIGAGPQGLAAAAHLLERGLEPLVLERGPRAAAAVTEWGHVRLFSEWPELVDAAAARLLAPTGWSAPTSGYPLGSEWVSGYLAPLAAALGDRVRLGARVTGVARAGHDLIDSGLGGGAGRDDAPFTVHVARADGREERLLASAVIDASGTWSTPSPAGADGLPAIGEAAARAAGLVSYRIPTVDDLAEHAGHHTVVIGNGHSALGTLVGLAEVVREHAGTRVTWVLRRGSVGATFGGGASDALVARGALGKAARRVVNDGLVQLVRGFRTESIRLEDDRAVLVAEDGRSLDPADAVIVLTGFRPDLSILREVRLAMDARLEAPVRLAAEIDPAVHTCGTVRQTGAAELEQPETDLYIVGAKSYGRAPTFLALTGYEQVRSVVAALAGDHEAASRCELTLPETGVCSGAGSTDATATAAADAAAGSSGCCATPVAAPVTLERAPHLVDA